MRDPDGELDHLQATLDVPARIGDRPAVLRGQQLAGLIAANGPVVVRAILRTIRETEGMHENDAFKIDARLGMEVFVSEDAKDGPRAYAEKWDPIFTVTENPVTWQLPRSRRSARVFRPYRWAPFAVWCDQP